MATHSSIFAWRILQTEDPGGLHGVKKSWTQLKQLSRQAGMAQTVKNTVQGALGLIPGLGRSPEEENDNPLQCSCLENPTDRGVRQATIRHN